MEIIIRASEGMWLTDGEIYGKTISLAKGVNVDRYHEITDEEYNQIMLEQSEESIVPEV